MNAKQTASDLYTLRREDIARLLDWLDLELDKHRAKAEAQPSDWGYAGDLGYVIEKLTQPDVDRAVAQIALRLLHLALEQADLGVGSQLGPVVLQDLLGFLEAVLGLVHILFGQGGLHALQVGLHLVHIPLDLVHVDLARASLGTARRAQDRQEPDDAESAAAHDVPLSPFR